MIRSVVLAMALTAVCLSHPLARIRRQITRNRLQEAVCRSQPSHSMCRPSINAPPATLSLTEEEARRSACRRNPGLSFCARETANPFAGWDALDFPPVPVVVEESRMTENCQDYEDEFEKQCLAVTVEPRIALFCEDYAKECGRVWQSRTVKKAPFCDTYADDFNTECRKEIITQRLLIFCQDYSGTCQEELGPTQQTIDDEDSDVTCSEERKRYSMRCTAFEIEEGHKDYCIEVHRACGWQLGPGIPDSITDGNSGFPRPPTPSSPSPPSEAQKRAICKENEDQARVNCFQAVNTKPEHVRPCTAFIRDCLEYYEDDEPLRRAATLFNSRVGVNSGFGLNGIPFYPLSDGNLAIGESTGADFGTWGGGASSRTGVGDFFELSDETGANWYEGKYGTQSGWGVPLLPFINGRSGTQVTVPINERNLGDPIGVNKGGGVGPFATWGEGTSVDWLNGNVGNGKSWGVPLIGLGGGTTSGVSFPSIGKFLPLINALNG